MYNYKLLPKVVGTIIKWNHSSATMPAAGPGFKDAGIETEASCMHFPILNLLVTSLAHESFRALHVLLQLTQRLPQHVPGAKGIVPLGETSEVGWEQPPSNRFADQCPTIKGVLQQGAPLGTKRNVLTWQTIVRWKL